MGYEEEHRFEAGETIKIPSLDDLGGDVSEQVRLLNEGLDRKQQDHGQRKLNLNITQIYARWRDITATDVMIMLRGTAEASQRRGEPLAQPNELLLVMGPNHRHIEDTLILAFAIEDGQGPELDEVMRQWRDVNELPPAVICVVMGVHTNHQMITLSWGPNDYQAVFICPHGHEHNVEESIREDDAFGQMLLGEAQAEIVGNINAFWRS